MNATRYARGLEKALQAAAIPTDAEPMARYMKNHFVFLGLKMPLRNAVIRRWVAVHGLPAADRALEEVVLACYDSEYREMHYAGLYLLERQIRHMRQDHHRLLEELVLTHSWWDTVDWLAKLAGLHLRRFTELVPALPDRWMDSNQMWLQRVAILFQLGYKADTDSELLFRYILRVADSREFFLQKAAGWALRQYSRSHPDLVAAFLQSHTLPALTRREGGRLLPNS